MKQRFITWLHNTKLRDPIERGQAVPFQIILLVLIVGGAFNCFILVLIPASNSPGVLVNFYGVCLLLIAPIAALLLLRRGRFTAAVMMLALGLILSTTIVIVGISMSRATPRLFMYLLPLTLAGLLAPRRYLLTTGMMIAGIIFAVVLEAIHSPLTGFIPLPPELPGNATPPFIVISVLMTIFFTLFGSSLRQALNRAQAREHELEQLRASLEATVLTRTGDLRSALAEVEKRAAEQACLLEENTTQRNTMREMSVPILPLDANTLVIPLIGTLDSARLQNLQEHALRAIEQRGARRILLDVTGV